MTDCQNYPGKLTLQPDTFVQVTGF